MECLSGSKLYAYVCTYIPHEELLSVTKWKSKLERSIIIPSIKNEIIKLKLTFYKED